MQSHVPLYKRQSQKLIERIIAKRGELIQLLTQYESMETAEDEIFRSIDCLKNIDKEQRYLDDILVNTMSAFLPVNLPLYSLILFGIIPGYLSKKVHLRPPVVARKLFQELATLLDIAQSHPFLKLKESDRQEFVQKYVKNSDVVLFTGTHGNAMKVLHQCRGDSLFIYNGAGINPIVITKDADINLAVEKTVQARVFDSGQDCAGPDVIFVARSISEYFLEKLLVKINAVKVGAYSDTETRIGKILSADSLIRIGENLNKNAQNIISGGLIDFRQSIVYPTVIVSNINEKLDYLEWFSPVFFISLFNSKGELEQYFESPKYKDYAMYVSVFGEYDKQIPNSVILKDKNILDVERGNDAYGGYGHKANFSYYKRNGKKHYFYRPILISREIFQWKKESGLHSINNIDS